MVQHLYVFYKYKVSITIYMSDLLCVKKLSTFIQAYTISSFLFCKSKEAVLQFCSIASPLNINFSVSIYGLSVFFPVPPAADCPFI